MAPKEATSIRISADIKRDLEERAREAGVPATALYERFIYEGLRQHAHPLIAFRHGEGGRRPTLAGTRLSVAQVIESVDAAEGRGDAAVRETAEYLGIPEGHVRACVRYYAAYPDEIDEWRVRMVELAERERDVWEREQAVLA
jgi:uncharacterized protein (DUF433 family)